MNWSRKAKLLPNLQNVIPLGQKMRKHRHQRNTLEIKTIFKLFFFFTILITLGNRIGCTFFERQKIHNTPLITNFKFELGFLY